VNEFKAPQPDRGDAHARIKQLLSDSADNGAGGTAGADPQPGQGEPLPDNERDDRGTGGVDIPEPGAGESVPDAAEDTPSAVTDDPITVARLAESLGVAPADVYELEVPMGDGKTVTLGEMKDAFKAYGPVKEAEARNRSDRQDFEKQVLKTRSDLSAIIAAIPPQIRDHVVRAARERNASWEQEQEKLALETMPELGDSDKRAKFRQMLVEDGAEYGFSEQEITYTQDARTLRWMRDFAEMKRELAAMKAAAKAAPARANAPGKGAATNQSKQRLRDAIVARGRSDPTAQGKQAAIAQLLRS
jgi:hypothetical protein